MRSLLYVPAHSERFVAKAHERGADAIILDLEDSVPEDAKDQARLRLADAMADQHFEARQIIVDVEDATFGTVPMHNIVPRLSATPGTWRLPAPELGQHNDEVLFASGNDPQSNRIGAN